MIVTVLPGAGLPGQDAAAGAPDSPFVALFEKRADGAALASSAGKTRTTSVRRLVTIAVAPCQPRGQLLAIGRACHGADLRPHQAFGRKADHLAQQIGARGLLHKVARAIMSLRLGGISGPGWCQQPDLPALELE